MSFNKTLIALSVHVGICEKIRSPSFWECDGVCQNTTEPCNGKCNTKRNWNLNCLGKCEKVSFFPNILQRVSWI